MNKITMLLVFVMAVLFVGCEKPAESGEATAKDSILGSVKDGLKQVAEPTLAATENPQEILYKVMQGVITEEDEASQKWLDARDVIFTPEMLNCEVLFKDPGAYASQREAIQTYIDSCKSYRDFSATMFDRLRERMERLNKSGFGVTEEMIEEAIEGLKGDYELQQPFYGPMMEESVAYGETMLKVLNYYEEYKAKWIFEDGQAIIYHDHMRREVDKLLNQLNERGIKIYKLSEELNNLEL